MAQTTKLNVLQTSFLKTVRSNNNRGEGREGTRDREENDDAAATTARVRKSRPSFPRVEHRTVCICFGRRGSHVQCAGLANQRRYTNLALGGATDMARCAYARIRELGGGSRNPFEGGVVKIGKLLRNGSGNSKNGKRKNSREDASKGNFGRDASSVAALLWLALRTPGGSTPEVSRHCGAPTRGRTWSSSLDSSSSRGSCG